MEEGKEGDMSDIAVDITTDTIYAGILVIPEGSVTSKNISLGSYDTANDAKKGRFIQLGNTGPDQIMVNDATDTIYPR